MSEPAWKVYSESLHISDELGKTLQLEIEQAKEHARASLFTSVFAPEIPKPPPSITARFRSWLGWKLWRIAARLEPDVTL